MLRQTKAGINAVYVRDAKKSGLFSHLVRFFDEYAMNIFSNLHFKVFHPELPDPLILYVQFVKRGFEKGWFVPALAHFNAVSTVAELFKV